MGNALQLSSCASCACSAENIMRNATRLSSACGRAASMGSGVDGGGVTVVHTGTERLVEVGEGATAAEIMLEHPNHFLVCGDAASMAPGKRLAALAAHQVLLPNHLYFLMPMHKLRGRLSAQEVAQLGHLTRRLTKRPPWPRDRFILPPSALINGGGAAAGPALALSTYRCPSMEYAIAADHTPEQSLLSSFINRTPPPASMWRPSLQTIDETPHLRSWIFFKSIIAVDAKLHL